MMGRDVKHSFWPGLVAALLLTSMAARAEVDRHTHPHPGPVADEARGLTVPQDFWKSVDVGFLVELEAFAAKTDDVNESDISLATVELTVDADVVEGVRGYLGLLWEEDTTEEDNLDEAYLAFGSTEAIPFYAMMGRMYLPFGNFVSAFISDPLTLELGEIRESAALAGFASDWVDVSAGAFNGDLAEGDEDNGIDNGFAAITFTPLESVSCGAYWLSDLLEADGFEDFVESAFPAPRGHTARAGAGGFVNARLGPVTVNAEYLAAIESIDLPGRDLRPWAYNAEASMPVCEKTTVGVKFEGSDDFHADFGSDKWPDWQTGFVVSHVVDEHVVVSAEYLHGEGLDDNDSREMATVQVALVL